MPHWVPKDHFTHVVMIHQERCWIFLVRVIPSHVFQKNLHPAREIERTRKLPYCVLGRWVQRVSFQETFDVTWLGQRDWIALVHEIQEQPGSWGWQRWKGRGRTTERDAIYLTNFRVRFSSLLAVKVIVSMAG
jgi:hypothetical protein